MANKFDFNMDAMHQVLNDDRKAGSLYMAAKLLLGAVEEFALHGMYGNEKDGWRWQYVVEQMAALRNALGLPRKP
jgi:uncharacterized protein YfiM (DUF2279 family)